MILRLFGVIGLTGTLCAQETFTLPTMTTSSLFALVYTVIMVASALGFYAMRRRYGDSIPLIFYVIHTIIVLWSGLMYVHFIFDTVFAPYVYYMDWIVSTPLIVLALTVSALIQTDIKPWGLVLLAMAFQAMTIVSGLFAQISGATVAGLTFFGIGNLAMFGLFCLLWGPFMRIARVSSVELYAKYRTLGIYIILFWIAYPLIWILGTPGLKILSDMTTQILFIVLPILCKAGFGFLDLYLLNKLSQELNERLAFVWISIERS